MKKPESPFESPEVKEALAEMVPGDRDAWIRAANEAQVVARVVNQEADVIRRAGWTFGTSAGASVLAFGISWLVEKGMLAPWCSLWVFGLGVLLSLMVIPMLLSAMEVGVLVWRRWRSGWEVDRDAG